MIFTSLKRITKNHHHCHAYAWITTAQLVVTMLAKTTTSEPSAPSSLVTMLLACWFSSKNWGFRVCVKCRRHEFVLTKWYLLRCVGEGRQGRKRKKERREQKDKKRRWKRENISLHFDVVWRILQKAKFHIAWDNLGSSVYIQFCDMGFQSG